MPDDWEKDFVGNDSDWEEHVNADEQGKREIEKAVYEEDDGEQSFSGLNVAFTAYEHKGKTLMATLLGFLNTEYFDTLNVKEKFPKTYQMIKEGVVPEVEKIQVLDLDCSYKKLSHLGIFGKLVKPLYIAKKIKRTTIKIPKRKIDFLN